MQNNTIRNILQPQLTYNNLWSVYPDWRPGWGTANRWAGRPGDRMPVQATFSGPSISALRPTQPPALWVSGYSSGVRRLKRDANRRPDSSAVLRMGWSYAPAFRLWLQGHVICCEWAGAMHPPSICNCKGMTYGDLFLPCDCIAQIHFRNVRLV